MTTAGLMRTTSAPPLQSYGGTLFARSRSSTSLSSSRTLHFSGVEKKQWIQPLQRAQSEADLSIYEGGISCQAKRVDVEAPPETKMQLGKVLEVSGGNYGGAAGGSGGGKPGHGGSDGGKSEIGAYYLEMLEADPCNPLLLRNYGRFLHEVEGDYERAEECYGRAILATPGDGEVLSLYGNLIWQAHGDEQRAESYFERAVEASPDDCYVMGSYAHFLWDAEESGADEEGDQAAAPPQELQRMKVEAY